MNILDIELPKWPAMTVTGKNVSIEQAVEINFRTLCPYETTNDTGFLKHYADTLGFSMNEYRSIDMDMKILDHFQVLPLDNLCNYNIMSSWIGGPHGWCQWDGTIFTNSYNIGKDPTVRNIRWEWKEIAKAFPFLDLTCQLWSGECGEPDITPIVEFIIRDGTVKVSRPKNVLVKPEMPDNTVFFDLTSKSEHITPEELVERFKMFQRIISNKD